MPWGDFCRIMANLPFHIHTVFVDPFAFPFMFLNVINGLFKPVHHSFCFSCFHFLRICGRDLNFIILEVESAKDLCLTPQKGKSTFAFL